MTWPVRVLLQLLAEVRLGDRVHPAGAIIEVGIDVALHLQHQRRAVPVNSAGHAALLSHVTGRH